MRGLVQRMDSAHMSALFSEALECSDSTFLTARTEITLEQVRKLRLDESFRGREVPKMKAPVPLAPKKRCQPQPPNGRPNLSKPSIDLLLVDAAGDIDSWLVPLMSSNQIDGMDEIEEYFRMREDEQKPIIVSPSVCNPEDSDAKSVAISEPLAVMTASPVDFKTPRSQSPPLSPTANEEFMTPEPYFPTSPGVSDSHSPPKAKGKLNILNQQRSSGTVTHTPAPKRPPRPSISVKAAAKKLMGKKSEEMKEEEIKCQTKDSAIKQTASTSSEGESLSSRLRSRIPKFGLPKKEATPNTGRSAITPSPTTKKKSSDSSCRSTSMSSARSALFDTGRPKEARSVLAATKNKPSDCMKKEISISSKNLLGLKKPKAQESTASPSIAEPGNLSKIKPLAPASKTSNRAQSLPPPKLQPSKRSLIGKKV